MLTFSVMILKIYLLASLHEQIEITVKVKVELAYLGYIEHSLVRTCIY